MLPAAIGLCNAAVLLSLAASPAGALHGAAARTFGDGTPAAMRFALPPRVFQLRGGDQFTAELLQLDGQGFRVRLRGGAAALVPKSAVAAVAPLPGWRDVLAMQASAQPSASIAGQTHALPHDVPRGLVALAFEDIAGGPSGATEVVRLTLSGGDWTGTLALHHAQSSFRLIGDEGSFRLACVPTNWRPGRHVLVCDFDADGLRVLLDGDVIARGDGIGPLRTVRVDAPASAAGGVDVAALYVVERRASLGPLRQFGERDTVADYDGGTFFGTVSEADHRRLILAAAFGDVELPWRNVAGVTFADHGDEAPLTEGVSGWIGRVTFRPLVGGGTDQLTGAVRGVNGKQVTIQHEVLGEVAFPLDEVRRIEPLFHGARTTLAAGPFHLGDDVRRDFRSPRAGGARVEGTWTHRTNGRTFLRVLARDLSPAGPETALGSVHLRALQQGRFVTRLNVNGRDVGTLNDLISTSDGAASLRLEVPADLLRPGENTWAIDQTPLTPTGDEYDDCEIGPVILEVETAEARQNSPVTE
jgi:hypothetical protein